MAVRELEGRISLANLSYSYSQLDGVRMLVAAGNLAAAQLLLGPLKRTIAEAFQQGGAPTTWRVLSTKSKVSWRHSSEDNGSSYVQENILAIASDRYSKSKSKLPSELSMAMGCRAAEEIIFGPDKVSNGAAGDIKMATDQARRMITEWGMSDKLGMIAYGDNSQELFLGHSVTQTKNVSEATAREIDAEIKDIIDRAYQKAKRILTENIEELHRLARGLLEHETLTGDEIRTVLRGEPVIRKVVDEPAPESRRASVPNAGRPAPQPPAGGPAPAPQPG